MQGAHILTKTGAEVKKCRMLLVFGWRRGFEEREKLLVVRVPAQAEVDKPELADARPWTYIPGQIALDELSRPV